MSRNAWALGLIAFACTVGGACGKGIVAGGGGGASSDPVVARMIAAEREACACTTLTCATAAERELSAWLEVHRDDVARAVAEPTREAQIDLHRGRADACRRALYDNASTTERAAAEPEDAADAAIALMGRLADKLCACSDMKCAQGVTKEMSSIEDPGGKPTEEQMDRARKIAVQIGECQAKQAQAEQHELARQLEELNATVAALAKEKDDIDQALAAATTQADRDRVAGRQAELRRKQAEAQKRIDMLRVRAGVQLGCPPGQPLC